MFEKLIIIFLIIAVAILLFSVRLLWGKKFVHTHIDGNEALNKKGIKCVHEMDLEERKPSHHQVKE